MKVYTHHYVEIYRHVTLCIRIGEPKSSSGAHSNGAGSHKLPTLWMQFRPMNASTAP